MMIVIFPDPLLYAQKMVAVSLKVRGWRRGEGLVSFNSPFLKASQMSGCVVVWFCLPTLVLLAQTRSFVLSPALEKLQQQSFSCL